VASGTWGSAGGVLLHLGLVTLLGAGALAAPLYLLVIVAITLIGVRAADVAERHYARRDDGRIVIDEVAGQLIALAPLVLFAPAQTRHPVYLAAGFLLFRLFDIWKPGPVRAAERGFEGGWGVMLDDVVAGLLAALATGLLVAVGAFA